MKKLMKISAWLLGIIVGLLILLVIGFKLFFPQEKVKNIAIEQGSELLGRDITIGELDISIWGGLGLKLVNVAINNPEGFKSGALLTAENIDLKLYLIPLIKGDIKINRLVVNSPVIRMEKLADGLNNYNFTKMEEKVPEEITDQLTPETKAASVAVSFDQFEIEDGQIYFQNDSTGLNLSLKNISLTTSLKNDKSGIYNSAGKIKADSLIIESDKNIPSLSFNLNYLAEYNFSESLLKIKEADLNINQIQLSLSGKYSHALDDNFAQFNIKSNQIQLSEFVSFLPDEKRTLLDDYTFDGFFELDADIEYNPQADESLSYSGVATIRDMKLSQKEIQGELNFEQALIDFEPNSLRLNIEKASFDNKPLKGHLTLTDFENPSVNGIIAGTLNLAFVKPFIPPELEIDLAGKAQLDVKVMGNIKPLEKLDFSGNVLIEDGYFNAPQIPEPLESFYFDAYFDRDLTKIKNTHGKIKSGEFSFEGRINHLIPYLLADTVQVKEMDVMIDGNFKGILDLSIINQYLPPKGNPKLTGKFDTDLTLSGSSKTPEKIIKQGVFKITDGQYQDDLLPEPVESFETILKINPDTITVEMMDVIFTSSNVSFTGKISNPFPYLLPFDDVDRSNIKKPLFTFNLNSTKFDIDKLFPEVTPGAGTNRTSLPEDSISMLILPDINGLGKFDVDTLIYSKVEFSNINGDVKIADRKIICYDVTGMAYTGKVAGETTIDLNNFDNPHYIGKFDASQIEADDFIDRFSKFGGHLYGKIDLKGSYDAFGWDPESFLNSLSMSSTMSMKEGKMITSGFAYNAMSSLASKIGESFESEQVIRNMWTNVEVKDGKVKMDALKISTGSLGDITLDGFYGFNGELDYKGDILLSKAWTEKLISKGGLIGGLSNLFSDKSVERIKLPLTISNTVDDPKMNLDFSVMVKDNKKKIKEKAGDLLKGLFKK